MCAAEVDHNVARRYVLKRRLGKGAYGIVWKAVDRRTGEIVAIKKIFDAFRDKTDAQRTFREIMLLQEFGDHPNIIRLLDLMQAENDRDIYLVFEFMDTDLHAVIRKGGLLKDIHRRYIFYQLLWATNFIHSAQVIHRDLKPSNILLDANCMVKVCDFGLARSLSSLPEGTEGQALTNYVATRWYRAPEVLLSSSWYTPGVDMWSLGCVLGEMLRGQPLFPGTSTLHQLQLILETIPPPLEEELSALGSGCSTSILHSLGSRPQQMLDTILPPDTPPEALDLLRLLLVFAPHKRLTAAQALQHPYVQRFHCSGCDQIGRADVQLLAQDGVQLSATEYRSRIYQMILEQRSNGCVLKKEGLRGAPLGAEPRASRSYAHLLKPRAGPQLSLGPPVQNPGLMPQSSPSLDPEHEAPRAAKNILSRNPASLPQSATPGVEVEPPSLPSRLKHNIRGAAPSLTSQAAAQMANQALIRKDWSQCCGVRAAGPHLVSPACVPPLPFHSPNPQRSPLLLSPRPTFPYADPYLQIPPQLPPDPRPGRKMFSSSASQGALGAARSMLGGYSQAYGTICHSALGRLPLLPGPHA
ncbi:mitogen-activated protein kinase 15 isoform X2 [Nycticebus coucang]|uniref:mitogen-activated protein kinase 15 isoform X2 n=1 Tax=Nycticebus coucang TaxID=9470 RepID=UPI00234D00A8|nr:mitogen-activated protein kinase 15 isoform X2 [Nycticebus coucang]